MALVKPPNLSIRFNTSKFNESEWKDNEWYQVRWIAKVFNEGKNQKIPDYELMGELDAYTADITALSFIKWPEDHNARCYYVFTCEFMDYVGDNPEGITEEPPPPSFADVTLTLDCYWKDNTPFVSLESSGSYERDRVDVFNVSVDTGDNKLLKSVSVDIENEE